MNDPTHIIIRAAEPQDAEALLSIYAYYIQRTAITFEYDVPSVAEFRQRIEQTLLRYPYLVAVDEESGSVVGYAYASELNPRAAYQWSACSSIYLDHTVRHHGLGSLLQTALEKALVQQGIRNLYALITTADQPDEYLTLDSQHFHHKMGFEVAGHFHRCGLKFDKWYDVLWMEKYLSL